MLIAYVFSVLAERENLTECDGKCVKFSAYLSGLLFLIRSCEKHLTSDLNVNAVEENTKRETRYFLR